MNNGELLEMLEKEARDYAPDAAKSIIRSSHMNNIHSGTIIDQNVVDAVLVGFINRVGYNHGLDYAMYTKDLYNGGK